MLIGDSEVRLWVRSPPRSPTLHMSTKRAMRLAALPETKSAPAKFSRKEKIPNSPTIWKTKIP